MQIFERLEDFHPDKHPIVLTIGNFDGMHRGHKAVLQKAKAFADQLGQVLVLTFNNHPSEILRPETPISLLCHLTHKIYLLKQAKIESLLLLPFTRYLAQHSASSFIEGLRQYIPFSHLVLGHDATLGRDRQGNRSIMETLGEQWGFVVHYIDEYRFEGQPVSSTRIRIALQQGDLEQVEILLDRPYSIYGPIISGDGQGKHIGWPTANLDITGLCLPPFGVYAVEILHNNQTLLGIGNLGIAPSLKTAARPLLEVHLFESKQNLYGQFIEVIFKQFIRPEKKFAHIEELQQQITRDIEKVKHFFSKNSW